MPEITPEVVNKPVPSEVPKVAPDLKPVIPAFFSPSYEPLLDEQVKAYFNPDTDGYAHSVLGIIAEGQPPQLERGALLDTMLRHTLQHAGVSAGEPENEKQVLWHDDRMATVIPVAFEVKGEAAQSILGDFFKGESNDGLLPNVDAIRLYPVITPEGVRALTFVGGYDGLSYSPERNRNSFPLWQEMNSTHDKEAWQKMGQDIRILSERFGDDPSLKDAFDVLKGIPDKPERYLEYPSEKLEEAVTYMNRLYVKDRERKQEKDRDLEYFVMSLDTHEIGFPQIKRAEYRVNPIHNDRNSEAAFLDTMSVLIQPKVQEGRKSHWWPSLLHHIDYSDTSPKGRLIDIYLAPNLIDQPDGPTYSRDKSNRDFRVQTSVDGNDMSGVINIRGGNLIELSPTMQVSLLSQLDQVVKDQQTNHG